MTKKKGIEIEIRRQEHKCRQASNVVVVERTELCIEALRLLLGVVEGKAKVIKND